MKKIVLAALTALMCFVTFSVTKAMDLSSQLKKSTDELKAEILSSFNASDERLSRNVENVRQHYSFKKLLPGNITLLRGVALDPPSDAVIVEQSPTNFLYMMNHGPVCLYGMNIGGVSLMGKTPVGSGLILKEPDSEKEFYISVGLDNESLEKAVTKAYQYGYIKEIREIKDDFPDEYSDGYPEDTELIEENPQ
jgi:hypothetical protein